MPQPRPMPVPTMRWLLAPTLALTLAGLLLAGCTLLKPAPAPDPLAVYRPALRPGFTLTPAQLDALLRYSITVQVDVAASAYTGTLELTLPITGTAPLNGLYFRLYPNLKQFGGSMTVGGARVDGKTVNFAYDAEGTAVHLALPAPLKPGSIAQVWLSFASKWPQREPGYYTIFGQSEEIVSLTNFYPILAGRRGNQWALDIASPLGDVGFHDAALYQVQVTAPADQVLAATGVAVTRTVAADGWAATRYVQGPAREFTLLLSPRFQTEEAVAYGARVVSYFLPEDAAAGHSALYNAVASLEVYSDQFGLYPYREMAVVQAPLTFHGMEFPGLDLIGSQDYNQHLDALEMLVVHEVAHQWWYNQVGSDQTANPWLDEGLAEFSMYFYQQGRHGQAAADLLRRQRWEAAVAANAQRGLDATIGKPVAEYPRDAYETIVYGKGALFFATLRDEMGEQAFQKLLRTYVERYRWRIATPTDFRVLAEEVAGRDLGALFRKWVEGSE
ncbi:MAG: M1 family metallopeptidase [Chloroflexi bacterium]|nr:M1 family metallopeptidase [Chloroflexota bacterium]